jgi:phage nucleotide-binding protein
MAFTVKKPKLDNINPMMVLYGRPGTGKTTACGTLPNTLILDTERGSGSLTKLSNPPDVAEINTLKDLEEAYIFLKSGNHKYEHIVIDTFTEIQKMILAEVMTASAVKDPTRDINQATLLDYKKTSNALRNIIRKFKDLPYTIIFTAHVREDKDEETGKLLVKPSMTPTVSEDLAAFVDVILFLTVDKSGKRQVVTVPTDRIVAKHRYGNLKPIYEFEGDYVDLNILLDAMRQPTKIDEKTKGGQ